MGVGSIERSADHSFKERYKTSVCLHFMLCRVFFGKDGWLVVKEDVDVLWVVEVFD